MKITLLTNSFHPYTDDTGYYVTTLAEALIQKKHQVQVITYQKETSLLTHDNYKNIDVWRIPKNLQSSLTQWNYMLSKKQLIAQSDLVEIHNTYLDYLPLRLILPQLPSFYVLHSDYLIKQSYSPNQFRLKLISRLATATTFVGNSSTTLKIKPDLLTYGATKLKPLPAGDKNRILVMGSIDDSLTTSIILTALKVILKRYPEIKVSFAGDGQMAWQARQLGAVMGQDTNLGKQLTNVFWTICTSTQSILDALAAGRQVICPYTQSLEKDLLVNHPASSSLVKVSSSEELIQKFTDLYFHTPEHPKLINKASDWASTQTVDQLVSSHLDLWTASDYKLANNEFSNDLKQLK